MHITFDGSGVTGSISSSTVRSGYNAIYLNASLGVTLTANTLYGQSLDALFIKSDGNTIQRNNIVANLDLGIRIQSLNDNNIVDSNYIYSNNSSGILLQSSFNTFSSNRIFSNFSYGIFNEGSGAVTEGNTFALNTI